MTDSQQQQQPSDPPPPYPSRDRRSRRSTRRSQYPRGHVTQPSSIDIDQHDVHPDDRDRVSATEDTPLLPTLVPSPHFHRTRARTVSTSTSTSGAPSLAHTVLSLFQPDSDLEIELTREETTIPGGTTTVSDEDQPQSTDAPCAHDHRSRWRILSKRAWKRYFRPMQRDVYYAALFHLLVLNLPYAIAAWVYLFVFTLTGTTLLVALPLGAVLCFLDLLGARAFSRGELALQTRFHTSLAYPDPYPPRPIFTRLRDTNPPPSSHTLEADANAVSTSTPVYEYSFYKNTYSMFTDPTSYQSLFYFLVIKPPIALALTLLVIIVVPPSLVLVFPAPAILRAVRRLGIWQANVAVEGLYYSVR